MERIVEFIIEVMIQRVDGVWVLIKKGWYFLKRK